MEHGALNKQIYIEAPPAIVYEVVSNPAHVEQWWSDGAAFEPTAGSAGALTWRGRARNEPFEVCLTVVDAVPGERFSFRWLHPAGEAPTAQNSMLVTFELLPQGEGTMLTLTEEGMREQGWEAAVLEEYYNSHDRGWDEHLADLAVYAKGFARR